MNPYGDYVNEVAEKMLAELKAGTLTVAVALRLIEDMEKQADALAGVDSPWEGFGSASAGWPAYWPALEYSETRKQWEFPGLRAWKVYLMPGSNEGHYLVVEAMELGKDGDRNRMRSIAAVQAKTTCAAPSYELWQACARISYVLHVGTCCW